MALAEAQHGVLATWQLTGLGLASSTIHAREQTRRLHRVHRGVYAIVPRTLLAPNGFRMAAALAGGPDAALSHRSAGDLRAVRPHAGRHEISVPGRGGRRPRTDLVVHRPRSLDPADVERVDGIPVTTWARTMLDLAATIRPDHLPRALTRSERLRVFDRRAIDDAVARTPNHPGVRPLLGALAALHPQAHRTRSHLEDAMLAVCDAHRLPRPKVNEEVLGREVDFVWADQGLLVETDGWEDHGTRVAFQSDRTRDRALTIAGFSVLRFTYDDVVFRGDATGRELAAALAARSHTNI
jgi:very-short-patch-repair endonuclease